MNVLNSNWKSEKIIQWLEDNPQHIFKIAGHLVVSPNQSASSSIRDKIYELIIQEHINQKELLLDSHINPDTPIAVFLTHFNQPFIKKFQEMDSALLDSMIKKTILFVEDGTAKDKPVLTLNLGQYAYITHTRNWNIVDAEILLSSFKSDILKPIEVNFNFLEYKENIFEYFFKNSNLDVKFSIGLKQEFPNLSEEEKKMYTASCMKILSKQNSLDSNTQNLIDLLDVVPSKMANLYFSKAIDSFNQNITSYVSTHLLKNGLEQNLETRTITKQPKI